MLIKIAHLEKKFCHFYNMCVLNGTVEYVVSKLSKYITLLVGHFCVFNKSRKPMNYISFFGILRSLFVAVKSSYQFCF